MVREKLIWEEVDPDRDAGGGGDASATDIR